MPHHSPTTIEERQQEQLAQILADLKKPAHILAFLTIFMSESELTSVAKRLDIYKELLSEKSYSQIQAELGVSSATISALAPLKNTALTPKLQELFAAQDWAERTARKIRSIFHLS